MARLSSSKVGGKRFASTEHATGSLVCSYPMVEPIGHGPEFSLGFTENKDRQYGILLNKADCEKLLVELQTALKAWAGPVNTDHELWFAEPIISHTWYTHLLLHADATVTILHHYRLHGVRERGDQIEIEQKIIRQTYQTGRIKEDSLRNITSVTIDGLGECKVRNPGHVFSFDKDAA